MTGIAAENCRVNNDDQTIAAIVTAAGPAGVSIVRLSGAGALAIADRILPDVCPPLSARPAGTFHLCRVRDPEQKIEVDQVLALVFRAPHSYTGEDVVELQGHGGRICAELVLGAACAAGARVAGPGEFTRRAFLNGRMDLVQAEAVADLVRATTDRAASAALQQLEGALSERFTYVYEGLLSACADIEAMLDFDEDEMPDETLQHVTAQLPEVEQQLTALLDTWREGHLLRDGARVVIAGPPNAGKSTLFNQLLKKERAIVTEHPGTTRDTVEETLVINGIPIHLIDTAGIRETQCGIEAIGIRRTEESLQSADAILYVSDASQQFDTEILTRILEKNIPTIHVINKVDMVGDGCGNESPCRDKVRCAAAVGEGVNNLKTTLINTLGLHQHERVHPAVNARHREALNLCRGALSEAICLLRTNDPSCLAPAASRLREAAERIGEVIGRTYTEDLLDKIFSQFCVGK